MFRSESKIGLKLADLLIEFIISLKKMIYLSMIEIVGPPVYYLPYYVLKSYIVGMRTP